MMSMVAKGRREGWRMFPRETLLVVAVCVWFAADTVLAVDSAVDADSEERIASNQAISLSGARTEEVVPGAEVALTSPDESSPAPKAAAGDETRAPERTDSRQGRLVTRRPDTGDSLTQLPPQPGPWYGSGLVPLGMVLLVVGAAYWAVRRWMPSARSTGSDVLRIVARTGMGPKQSLLLIQLARRFVLVGASADRIETLCTVTDPDEVADLAARTCSSPGPREADRFTRMLLKETDDYREAEASAEPVEEDPGEWPAAPARASGASKQLSSLLGKLKALRAG
jgi:flagellar biogenesis protein FliO